MTRLRITVVSFCLLLELFSLPGAMAQPYKGFQNNLMPAPAVIRVEEGGFQITSNNMTLSVPESASPLLLRAIGRTVQRIEDKTGLEISREIKHDASGTLQVVVHSNGSAVQSLDEDESYHLTTTPTLIRVEAQTPTGALRGLETLYQLIQPTGSAFSVPSVMIEDQPRFRWRGLMIDCGRHFEPVEVLKRNLDAMAAVKLNVFHWHLTEDQGFRIESKEFPKLTGEGSDGNFYTQEDAREIVRYARDRGIRVVPEFEMPGHSAAWLFAYPELASGTNPTGIRREFGVSDFAMDPTREETYQFIEKFLKEMTTIFPDSYVHIGGDEAPAPDWKKNPRILAFMKSHDLADNDALQAYFNRHVLAILTKLNRRMVGWDEIFNPALPKDVVIQSWRGEASLAKAATQGYQGVLSAPYYLDGMKSAETHYLADPIPADTSLTTDQQKLILGGEICMWGEQLDERTIDSRIWPRTAAIAERFWSSQNHRDIDDMYRRLEPMSIELQTLGSRHLSSEDTHLRDLIGSDDIDALRTVASAFEPVSFGERYQQQHTSQLTPLTSFVDAVRPDPPIRHQLEVATREFLGSSPEIRATAPSRQVLDNFFSDVGHAIPKVQQQVSDAPRLQPIEQRLQQLTELVQVAQQSIQYLTQGSASPADWKDSSLEKIEAARKPSAIVRFDFLDALSGLVKATH